MPASLGSLIRDSGIDWPPREERQFAGQGPNFPLSTVDNFLDFVAGESGSQTWSGANVTTTTAMRVAAVWACIDVISKAIAQLPIITYRLLGDGDDGKERAKDHYLYSVLKKGANPLMTAFRFKRLMQVWLCLYGNAIAWLNVNGRGQVTEMWPWLPSRVEVELRDGEPWYIYRRDNGEKLVQPWWNILHIRGLETDGFWGLSPIAVHRQTIGLSLAVREHGARFFSNGARPLGVIQHPGQIGEDALRNLRESWNATHGGLSNAHKVAILEEGMSYQAEGLTMVDAQYLETTQMAIEDIARIYNVPPHKIGHLLRSTNNNIEHQGLEWLQDSIGPWITNWEAELTFALLSDREAQDIQIEFLVNALMRTDAKARADFYSKALAGAPWMDQDEVRRLENLNPKGVPKEGFPITNNSPAQGQASRPQEEDAQEETE